MSEKSCREFIEMLASKEPVPGGGGASAMVGAVGVALGSMVGNLTLGKKKYEDVREDISRILNEAEALQNEMLSLVEKDAEVFLPLSKAYGLPKNTEEEKIHRDEIMEGALKIACSVPIEIMDKSLRAIALHEELATKGSRIVISDVGVGVLLCKSSLLGASLNVYINTKLMKDRAYAEGINKKTSGTVEEGVRRADKVFKEVEGQIK